MGHKWLKKKRFSLVETKVSLVEKNVRITECFFDNHYNQNSITPTRHYSNLNKVEASFDEKNYLDRQRLQAAIGPYSQAVQYGDFLFVSGQIAFDPKTGELVEGDIEVQTKRVLENLKAIIEAAGMTLEKCGQMQLFS